MTSIEQLLEEAKQFPHHSRVWNPQRMSVLLLAEDGEIIGELTKEKFWKKGGNDEQE